MGLFSKEVCALCGDKVGALERKKLVNKEGFVCKECEKKTSALINVGRFTKEQLEEHIEYMKEQDKLYREAFLPIDKKQKESFMYVETGIEFANDIAMFKFHSPLCDKKRDYQELFRYDQINSYEPYFIENTDQDGKRYSEVGVKIILNCSWEHDMKEHVGDRSFHPYVSEINVPRGKNVDSFDSDTLINFLNKLFGRYEDNSLVGSVKSGIFGTNKEKKQMEVLSGGLKALGGLAKAKMKGEEADKSIFESFENNAADLLTENRATYAKLADEVEARILG